MARRVLSKKQVAAFKRHMKRQRRTLPRVGRCKPVGGGFPANMAAAVICHVRRGNKHYYEVSQIRPKRAVRRYAKHGDLDLI